MKKQYFIESLIKQNYLEKGKEDTHLFEELFSEANHLRDKYDIFLSHSSKDNLLINALYYELINMGFSVFLDKKDADKTSIDDMAEHLKKAMKKSTYLLYVHTHNASLSKWTPWEIGYFDSRNKSSNILIMPTLDDSLSMASYRGQEYLTQYNGICVEGLENLRNLLHKIKKIYG